MTKYIIISIGAIIGANARYLIGTWFADRGWTAFPWSTLTINVTGSLILGFFLTLITERIVADPNYRLLVAVGFCGSYTTFSSLMYESFGLTQNTSMWSGLFNLVGSMTLGMLATVIGVVLARLI